MNMPDYLLRIIERLNDVTRSGTDKWKACCPAHDDKQASLSIGIGAGDKVLLHCFAGCTLDAICAALSITPQDLYPPKGTDYSSAPREQWKQPDKTPVYDRPAAAAQALGKIVATYSYTDEVGEVLYQCLRYEPKDFRQRRPDGQGGWVWSLKGVRRVLFQLPEVIGAIDARERIFLVEGEKDVLALRSMGLTATCNAMGANKWDPEYSNQLRGAHVVIVPDNDDPGRKHRDLVGDALTGLGATVRVLELPGLPDKGDISDWIAAGGDVDRLLQLAEAAPEWTAPDPLGEDGRGKEGQEELDLEVEREGPYYEKEGWLYWRKVGRDGPASVHLANFTARIMAQTIEDDGAECKKTLAMEATYGGQTYRFDLDGKSFMSMDWILDSIDSNAWTQPGGSIKDRTRHAIQVLSGKAPIRRIFSHTGWREIGEDWVYLHCDGAIGAEIKQDVSVRLDGSLASYRLPAVVEGEERTAALRASLQLLEVSEKPLLTIPLYASIWRSVIELSDFAIWISGRTQSGKSSLAALAQAHFGADWSNRKFPGAWKSTSNALMEMCFATKDALIVIDDYVAKTPMEALKLQEKAETVLRAQGNGAGRQRMKAEGGLRVERPPRGLIVSTAEDLPPGESLRARMVILEMVKGDLDIEALTQCQKNAGAGLYAQAMGAFLSWLAPDLTAKRQAFRDRAAIILRQNGNGELARMPDIISQLIAGSEMFYDFCREAGALTAPQHLALCERSWNSLWKVGMEQMQYQNDQEPANRFVELVQNALSSGKAYLATEEGLQPDDPDMAMACGWQKRQDARGDWSWVADGDRIGWIVGDFVYLLPDLAYNIARRIGDAGGEGIVITSRVLWKRCKERGFLVATDQVRNTSTVRKTLAGQRKEVLHFFRETLL